MPSDLPRKKEWHTSHADFFKSIFDHLKHIATLASGSILLLSTYLEKFFSKPLHAWLVAFSLGSLFLSLVASLVSYAMFLLLFPRPDVDLEGATTTKKGSVIALMVTWLSFALGVGAIAAFFLLNWYAGH